MGVEIIRMKDIDFAIGDNVSIKSGPMEGFSGKVTSINNETRKINVAVSMFGRETPVEIDYTQVEHMEQRVQLLNYVMNGQVSVYAVTLIKYCR